MRGLTARLVLSHILLAVLVLTGAGAFSYSVLVDSLRKADEMAREDRLLSAKTMANKICRGWKEDDLYAVAREIEAAVPGVSVTPLSPEDLRLSRVPVSSFSRMNGDVYYIAYVNGVTPDVRCPLRFVATDAGESPRVAALSTALLSASGLALVAAVLMAFLFSRSLTAPLRRLAFTAGRLAEGEWETPLPEQGPAELRELTGAFHQMSARLRQDFVRLQSDREHLTRLTAEVAHELRTPITALRTYHELLEAEEGVDAESRAELLRRSTRQVSRLEFLAKFLVDMVRLEANVTRLDLKAEDLAAVVRQSAGALEPVASRQGVALAVEAGPDPVPVLVDRHRMGQALDNLLQNALAWTPAGRSVNLRVTAADGQGVVTVADGGPGIPPEMMDRLFAPFARGEGSSGLGLGLAIVRAVAHSHGGSVSAANHPDGGALFTLKVPLIRSE